MLSDIHPRKSLEADPVSVRMIERRVCEPSVGELRELTVAVSRVHSRVGRRGRARG
jgi:hypothetical protein